MSDLRPVHRKITLGGQEFGLHFDLNAIDAIQERFDIPISELPGLLTNERTVVQPILFILTTLINEGIDDSESGAPHVDEKWVGRKITPANLTKLQSEILLAFSDGVPRADEDDPNAQGE